ncbi:MAG: tetratricopeptide repeat protein [Kangiellaceae bacterium]|nr:tetratricopeptide repeat protein [Kangiellaceae bacterium]MCW8997281.1 tetratricopeptide repeat protein [Kangiellaceae bacterium]MCW9016918.1 tetratricopeptide repeat protein [Kangiellaceae bacterium]
MKKLIFLTSLLTAGLSNSGLVYASKAIDAFNQQNYQEAKLLFKQHPNKSEKKYYLGRIALIEKDLDEAEDLLEEALAENPKEADYHYWFGNMSLLQAANASIFSAPGYASDAREHLTKALELDPKHTEAMKDLIAFYLNAPSIAGGSTEKAITMTEKLIQVSPLDGYQSKLNIYRKEEDKEKELETALILSEKFAQHPKALLSAGFSYQLHKDYPKAFELFATASKMKVKEDDLSPLSALYQLGRTAVLSEQQTQLGIQSLESYLEMETNDSLPSKNWARFRLASLYQQSGELGKAKKLAAMASKEDSDKTLKKRAKKLLKKLK